MPTVRTYGGSKVETEALPGARLTAAQTPLSEGAGLGEAEEQRGQAFEKLGAGVTKVGDTALTLEDQATKRANDIAVLNAESQLSTWENGQVYDPQNGALTKTGNAAFGLPETLGNAFSDKADEISNGLNNDDQRYAFEKIKLQHGQNLDLLLQRHVAQESRRYEGQELASSIENHTQAAIANAMDPRRVGVELQTIVDNIQTHGTNLGYGPEQLKQAIDDSRSKVHVGVIEQMLSAEQPQAAQVYFDEVNKEGQINGDQIARIEKALKEGTIRQKSQDITDTIMAGTYGVRGTGEAKGATGYLGNLARPEGGFSSELTIGAEIDGKEVEIPSLVPTLTPDEVKTMLSLKEGQEPPRSVVAKAIAFARERMAAGKSLFIEKGETPQPPPGIEQATPGRPEQPTLSQALAQAQSITNADLRDAVEKRIEHRFDVNRVIDAEAQKNASRDAFNILDQTPDVTKIPPSAWASFPGALRTELTNYAEKKRKGEPIETVWTTYSAEMNKAGQQPAAFINDNLLLYRAQLGDTEYKQLTDIQLAMRRGEKPPAVEDFRTKQQMINENLAAYGFQTEPSKQTPAEKSAVAQLGRMLDEKIAVASSLPGAKKPDNRDIQSMIDGILTTKATVPGSWWGLVPFSGRPYSGFPPTSEQKPLVNLTINDIPPEQRKQTEDKLRSVGLPVSDQTILNLYIDGLQIIANKKTAAGK
jgi:hypothetical protein